jgi:hypothetical protein
MLAMNTQRAKPAARTKHPKKRPGAAAKTKPAAPRAAPAKKPAPRVDFGAPVDGFFARQPTHLRPLLDELRRLVEEAAPDAGSSIKWGMPFYDIAGVTMCALGAHRSHVNLILPGPSGTYADPEGRLAGEGKTGKHLKLQTMEELPRAAVRRWLRTAAALARKTK